MKWTRSKISLAIAALVTSGGRTKAQALKNIREAISLRFDMLDSFT
jgi:hypothetical protein